MKNVIEFLHKTEIDKIIDNTASKVIYYLLNKVAFSQPEFLNNNESTGLQMTKEFLESWIAQSCGLKKKGAGNYPIDVYKEKNYGADVKFITAKIDKNGNIKKTFSNETSLGQNFQNGIDNIDLDTLFKNQDKEKILNKWKSILKSKFNQPVIELKLKNIYYFIFIKGQNNIYLSIAKINTNLLNNLTSDKITDKSLHIKNFIDDNYGKVTIYKSKKRMELRVLPFNLIKDNLTISWDFTEFKPTIKNLREIIQNNNLDKHIKEEIKKFFKINLK